jgi:uncharacterized cupin superfamily protein
MVTWHIMGQTIPQKNNELGKDSAHISDHVFENQNHAKPTCVRSSKMNSRHPQIKNLSEVEANQLSHGSKFAHTRRRIAAAAGSRNLGCSWYELPPGKQNFPHHYHFSNEEAFFVLSGTGQFRLGENVYPISAGDYIACPAGEESGHSIHNSGTEPMTYLAFSTAISTEVVVYPDSNKFSVAAAGDMQKGLKASRFLKILKDQPNVDYFLDEE